MVEVMPELVERIRRLEDRVEIEDVLQRYLLAIDDNDYDQMGKFLSDDSTLQTGQAMGGASGRDAVVSLMRKTRSAITGSVHTPHRAVISFESEGLASALLPAHLELAQGGVTMYAALRYPMTLSRSAAGWRISSHQILTIHFGSWDDAVNSLTSDLTVRLPGSAPVRGSWPPERAGLAMIPHPS